MKPSQLSPISESPELFLEDVLQGLAQDQKQLPCKYFYDERGSELFNQICELDEYYLTRKELDIMQRYTAQMGDHIGPGAAMVEFGSGSSTKTRYLLDHLDAPAAYVPVDISFEHLHRAAQRLAEDYPHIEILPVCADFTEDFRLPSIAGPDGEGAQTTVYFPGSTIGNFHPREAKQLLSRIASLCGNNGGLLIGIDLEKDVSVIEAAYNDSLGITDEFNLNILHRINRELEADFQVDDFRHLAVYNPEYSRVEIYAVSECDQSVTIGTEEFKFEEGERIITEYSHKYTIERFSSMAADVGLVFERSWTDEHDYFAVLHFRSSR